MTHGIDPTARPDDASGNPEPDQKYSCPAWCDMGDRHPFDSVTEDGAPARGHTLNLGEVVGLLDEHGRPSRVVYVDVEADEVAPYGPGAPAVALVSERTLLGAAKAREVAALLTAAADKLDAILGGE